MRSCAGERGLCGTVRRPESVRGCAGDSVPFVISFPATQPISRVPPCAPTAATPTLLSGGRILPRQRRWLHFSVRVFVTPCLWGPTFPQPATFRAGTRCRPSLPPSTFPDRQLRPLVFGSSRSSPCFYRWATFSSRHPNPVRAASEGSVRACNHIQLVGLSMAHGLDSRVSQKNTPPLRRPVAARFHWQAYRSSLSSPLSPQERALHTRPIIQATSADLDVGNDSFCFPVAQSATADGQLRQQPLFVHETHLGWRCLIRLAAHTTFPNTHIPRRRPADAQIISRLNIHTFALPLLVERLCASQCDGGCIRNTVARSGQHAHPKRKVSISSVQSHPRRCGFGPHRICSALAFARSEPTGF